MPTSKNKKTSVRLASYIRPKRYDLTLKPDLEAFTFSGKEVITMTLDKAVREITLHSKDIKIVSSKYEVASSKGKIQEEFANKISYNKKAETATFHFKNNVPKGKAKLFIVFEGIINETLRGFYKSTYEIEGVTKHIATTQFEATDARRAFPSFDEPAHKAIFDVTLIVPGTHTAISNTLPKSIKEHEAGYKIIKFAPTPKMSTYLLAFIIGEFEYIEGRTKDGVQIRVFTTAGKKHQGKFALDVAICSLEFYNDYFGIPYPLPILDLIALPDFESAAMENWGAITFRETAMLVDEKNSSLSNKEWVAIVIAHEIAHQWFGNLVTMNWWTDLWLNEGFASYMENLCIDALFPQWHVWDLYLADRYTVALRLDSLANSHPIEIEVHHPNEINEIFDMVSYAKGSAVIRMIAEYIGADAFRDGLRHYLKKHSYGNTHTVDLWHSFEKTSKKPVARIMKNWTGKTGYPLLSVEKSKNNYKISQQRFFSSRVSAKKFSTEKTMWQVPFHYESNGEVLKELVTKRSAPLIGTSIGKVNFGENTPIRVRYDKTTLERLKIEIEGGRLPLRDRLGVIRDLFALAEGGYIRTSEALEFSLSYKDEKEYIVWSEIAGGIGKIYNLIRDESYKDTYEEYARSLFSPLALHMTWQKKKGERHSDAFLRSLALFQAASYGDRKIINQAQIIYKNINRSSKKKEEVIHADIRSVIYNIVASYGKKKDWEEFARSYKSESHHEEQERYARALAHFRDGKLLGKTLEFALSKDVRVQDSPFIIGAVWQNAYGRALAWKFIKKNWARLMKHYGEGGKFLVSRLLSALGGHTKKEDAIDANKFFAKNVAPAAERTLEQAYERIYSNDAWRRDDKGDIKNWLSRFKK
jgi:puromycin-sensitive aminopeptidase